MLSRPARPLEIERLDLQLNADASRVLLRRYGTSGPEHALRAVERILALSENQVESMWEAASAEFGHRHRDYQGTLLKHFASVEAPLPQDLSPARKALLGACFSMEYSLECAALFNPSIVAHPDQSGLSEGSLRFVMSLRATGEGHISSITFRTGVIDTQGDVHLDEGRPHVESPALDGDAESGYTATFPTDLPIAEQTLFPITPSQSNGIEDARFVQFEDGTYYGTYTAYDGRQIAPEMVATRDFNSYRFLPLRGTALRNKGLALFPRKVGGLYTMLGRQDGENNYLMKSDDLLNWNQTHLLTTPKFDWEIVQSGNCGSPLETEAGWLVLTHGVGPTRKYSIGVMLLDLENPSQVIGRLETPLLSPNAEEREGYVPNVVYTCGAILHAGYLIIPYAVSDSACRFARVKLDELLEHLKLTS